MFTLDAINGPISGDRPGEDAGLSSLLSVILTQYFAGSILRVQQVVALFPQRLAEKLAVQALYGRVMVRNPHGLLRVDRIKRLHPRADRGRVGADGLPAAADAATRAGHDLDEMQILAAGANLIEQAAGIAEAAGDGHAQLEVVDFDAGFLDAFETANRLDVEIAEFAAGH